MENDINFKVTGGLDQFVANRRRHQFVGKWKTTTILLLMEDDLNVFLNVSFLLSKGGLASHSFS